MYKAINTKKLGQDISFTMYSIILFFFLTTINKFQFGVFLSGVILPIVIFIFFLCIENKKFILTETSGIICLFWLFAVFSTIISNMVEPQRDIFTFLVFCIFFIISTSIDYKASEIKLMIVGYIFICIVTSCNIINNFINDFAYIWKRYSLYVFGVYRDTNYVSAFIVPGIAILFYKLLINRRMTFKKKLLYYPALIIMIIGALATGSRGAFSVVAITVSLTFIYYLYTNNNPKMIFKIIILFILLIFSWKVLKNILPEFLIMRFTDFDGYTETSRLNLWAEGIQLLKTNPVFGCGLGSLRKYLFNIGLYDSHNLYLDILIGQGFIGFFLLLLVFVRFILVKRIDRVFMFIVTISFFVPLFFINGFNTATFWTPMILCEILSNYSRKSKDGIQGLLEEI